MARDDGARNISDLVLLGPGTMKVQPEGQSARSSVTAVGADFASLFRIAAYSTPRAMDWP